MLGWRNFFKGIGPMSLYLGNTDKRERFHFDAFLCHNSLARKQVSRLASVLEGRGLAVWYDAWHLAPGKPWQGELERIISRIGSALVLVGEDGVGPWQTLEMRSFLSESVRREIPVIPVLLPGTGSIPVLPLFLKELMWVDLRQGFRKSNIDRLIWGITGKKPNE